MVFYSISSNKDEVLSIKPCTYVLIFGVFNIHHTDWLTCSGGADQRGELCYNFSISNDLTQMINFPTRITDCNSYSPALLDFFLDTSICSTMGSPLLGNSDHLAVSVSIDFPSNSQRGSLFHRRACDYSRADWDGFVIIREMFHGMISLNSAFLLLLVNFVSGLRLKLMYITLKVR